MLHLLVALLVSQTPSAASGTAPRQVIVLDLRAVGVPADSAQILTTRIAATLVSRGLEVVTSADLRQRAELEATQTMDCDSAAARCLAGITNALGTRFVVSGEVGALDADHLVLELSLFDGELRRPIAREEATGRTLAQLGETVAPALDRLISSGTATATATTTTTTTTTTTEPSLLVPIGGGIAGVGVLGLAVAGLWATSLDGTLGSETARVDEKQAARDNLLLAFGGLGAAAVVTLVGGVVLVFGLLQE